MQLDDFLNKEIQEIQEQNLYRHLTILDYPASLRVKINNKKVLNLCSNNYLNYADNPIVKQAAVDALDGYGIGSTGSRLITGTSPLHSELEFKLANFKGTQAAMYLSCGYVANISTIAAILNDSDVVFSDELNHASIIDGIKLSRADKFIYKHNDIADLERLLKNNRARYSKAMIITDTIFSMDGDRAPLEELADLKEKYQAFMMIDEAHATGVIGNKGGGLSQHLGLTDKIEIHMGTLSKAVGVEGAYISGSERLIEYLRHKSRGFVFSTAPSPAIAGAIIKALDLIMEDSAAREKLWANIDYFKSKLIELEKKAKIQLIPTESAIFCFKVGDIRDTLLFQQNMFNEHNIFISAIRPPTVKTPRVRLCLCSNLNVDDLDFIIEAIKECCY